MIYADYGVPLVCHASAQYTCGKSATPLATVEVVAKLPQFQSLVEICGSFATCQKKKTPPMGGAINYLSLVVALVKAEK
jgi:hypothetical protein